MYFELSEEQRAMKKLAEKYTAKTIAPIHEVDESEGRYRPEIVKEMGRLGFWGAIIPEEYGGNDAGFLSSILITEAISKVSPAYAGHFLTQTVGTGLPILENGTENQKKLYLPALVSAELQGCFASTEPDAGADIISMKMTADETKDGFILNGTKSWITNAPEADIGLIFAYTDRDRKHNGISSFIVELKKKSGIDTSVFQKLGQRCSRVGEIIFNNAEVPGDSLIGERGQGFEILMHLLRNTRLFAAARALGLAEACLEKSMEYAKTRVQFGRSIGKFQMIQEQIAEMYINHEASRMLVYQAAANKDRGMNNMLEVANAKYFSCESAVKAADTSMKIYGAYGFSMEYPIQRYLRDSRAFVITEGSSNIQKMIIAKELLRS
ncbi:MAG: acyl-CoA dehydrogenase family protein [Thermodesulfobacteriota bacterium]|nr:acyl-CoA dehydrogenase family protein [Thermodesulfobacteriota bacterium]